MEIRRYEEISSDLKKFSGDMKIWFDPLSTSAALGLACETGGLLLSTPIPLMKVCMNDN